MDPAAAASASATPGSALAQVPPAFPGPLSPLPLLASGQGVDGSQRGACLWRPWLSSTSDPARQAVGGATGAEVTKADCEFHHPVRLFWPKSRSFDYLYRDGEILLQNFPVQATINLYEDSDSEEAEEEEEEQNEVEEQKKDEEHEEADEKGPAGCVRVPGSAPHGAAAYLPFPSLKCPNEGSESDRGFRKSGKAPGHQLTRSLQAQLSGLKVESSSHSAPPDYSQLASGPRPLASCCLGCCAVDSMCSRGRKTYFLKLPPP